MNIFNIQQDLLSLFAEIEDNEGELTPELEKQLEIVQGNFTTKVKAYTDAIKSLDNDLKAIKEEQDRLKQLADRKKKTSDKLKEIIINAVDMFGDVSKTGTKFIDYGTGKVSIRKSEIVDINEPLIEKVNQVLRDTVNFNKENNQLDVMDSIDLNTIITEIAQTTDLGVGGDDLNHLYACLRFDIPIKDLANGNGYNALKEIAKYTDDYKLDVAPSKVELKQELKENGSCAPNLAKIKINNNLTIK